MALWSAALRDVRQHTCVGGTFLRGLQRLVHAEPARDPVASLVLQPRHHAAEAATVDEPSFSGRSDGEASAARLLHSHQEDLVQQLRRLQLGEGASDRAAGHVALESRLPIRELFDGASKASNSQMIEKWKQQLENEEAAIDSMRSRYWKDIEAAMARGVAADLGPSRKLMSQWLEPLKAEIEAVQKLARVEAAQADGTHGVEGDAIEACVEGRAEAPEMGGKTHDLARLRLLVGQLLQDFKPQEVATTALQGTERHQKKQAFEAGTSLFVSAALHLGGLVNERMQLSKLHDVYATHNKWRAEMRQLFKQLDEIEADLPKAEWPSDPGRRAQVALIWKMMDKHGDLAEPELVQQLGTNDEEWTERFWAGKLKLRGKRAPPESKLLNARGRKRLQAEFEGQCRNEMPWSKASRMQVGGGLFSMLIDSAKIEVPARDSNGDKIPGASSTIEPAFWHKVSWRGNKMWGEVGFHEEVGRVLQDLHEARELGVPRFMPMVVKPLPWQSAYGGGYLLWRSCVMRSRLGAQVNQLMDAENRDWQANSKVYEALNALGGQGWRINQPMLRVVEAAWAAGGGVGDLPSLLPEPTSVDNMHQPRFRLISSPGQLSVAMSTQETQIERGARQRLYAKLVKKEREQHSQRCDLEIKLTVARKMKDEEAFYYPHNVDFRGRAYPMHLHLNHMGNDMCRGLLQFADGRPLGQQGLRWLCIQLANSYGHGVDKKSFRDRYQFVLDNLDRVQACAANPLADDPHGRWWQDADDPWQCLAACMEVTKALASGDAESFVSHHPVQVDGSCNGLQHYAALGRDYVGGAAVNLVAADKPKDVYTMLANRVATAVADHAVRSAPGQSPAHPSQPRHPGQPESTFADTELRTATGGAHLRHEELHDSTDSDSEGMSDAGESDEGALALVAAAGHTAPLHTRSPAPLLSAISSCLVRARALASPAAGSRPPPSSHADMQASSLQQDLSSGPPAGARASPHTPAPTEIRDHVPGKAAGLPHAAAQTHGESDERAGGREKPHRRKQQPDSGTDPVARAESAQFLLPHIDRKLVKQTVMTSVYGVTHVGAREQIASRLRERGYEIDNDTFKATTYGTKVTLHQLHNMFDSAKNIMTWLGLCASVIAHGINRKKGFVPSRRVSWTTPLGMSVSQPYVQKREKVVRTMLQHVRTAEPSPKLATGKEVARAKQRSAFPPNYIHSIDSCHMMMTAIACHRAGLAFAGVHDSFWTHAATSEQMNVILRDTFVELHSQPLLQQLKQQFEERYPTLTFPDVPAPSEPQLDLNEVKRSPYFFS